MCVIYAVVNDPVSSKNETHAYSVVSKYTYQKVLCRSDVLTIHVCSRKGKIRFEYQDRKSTFSLYM